jgi:hypothetical protein
MQDPDIVLYQLNHYKPLIDRAIKLTEEYVSTHKLILTGGMAIDLALRVKGQSIYADDVLPDYDIISDENLMHANAFAELLCKEGLPDINVINAAHVTTVRVRMKRIVLLDATYIPSSRFKQIPFLDIGHLRVVHPHYQFIDQRLSLAKLLMDTGASLNVFNRLAKDIKRNLLLRVAYPIESTPIKMKTRSISIPLKLIQISSADLNQLDPNAFVYTGPTCISGYVAMVLMLNKSKPEWRLTETDLVIPIPPEISISLLSCAIERALKLSDISIKQAKTYRPLINLKPVSICDKGYELVDTYGQRIGCNIIDLSPSVQVCVASVDYLLMELLRDRIYVNKEPYSEWYTQLVATTDRMREGPFDQSWYPSINCYGSVDIPEYRVLMLEKIMSPTTVNDLRPRNSYISAPKCQPKTGFIQSSSHYFQIDGSEDASITHTNHKYIIDEFQQFIKKMK